ncbi:MAG: efflux RND transporter permease subunit [Myxococcales bacterium]|nr:efflux RND transporter permease subunit [Myxococcales bacterium]
MAQADSGGEPPGPIAWMVGNRVTPNLLMLVLIVGGIFLSSKITQEVFPAYELDLVNINVPYPGASPEEVEQGIVLAVEEAVRSIEGVKEVRATAAEGMASIAVELRESADDRHVHQEIKQQIDRITTFPRDAEEATVTLQVQRRPVLSAMVYGEADEWALRDLAELVRDRLLEHPDISQVETEGTRAYELQVDVPRQALRSHGLTLSDVAQTIAQGAVDVPGGAVDTPRGETLLRMRERRDWASDYTELPVITGKDGSVVYLRDIAHVHDGFADTDDWASYDGMPAIGFTVYRVGDQTPMGISQAAREALAEIEGDLPPGVHVAINSDRSSYYQQRLHLLTKNAFMGLVLVLVLLGVFLEVRLAFWVLLGIPTSFLGAMIFLPWGGVTINIISMFAFILSLGIVVDDAIVAGENIFEHRQRGVGLTQAAIRGAREVAVPITFSIITNIVAFIPLMYVPGFFGKIWYSIPLVVGAVFIISWVEALFILPAHLAHTKRSDPNDPSAIERFRRAVARGLEVFLGRFFGPLVAACMRRRYLTVAVGAAVLMLTLAYAMSGRLGMILMPKVESDYAAVTATLPYGSPPERVREVHDRLVAAGEKVAAENGGDALSIGMYARVRNNSVEVSMYLTDPEVRPLSTTAVTQLWRQEVGELPGVESARFEADRGGPGRGPSVTVELAHRSIDELNRASAMLAEALGEFGNLRDVDDGFMQGKPQLDFQLTSAGRSLGLTAREVGRQVRDAFFGAEALRQQRGRNEVRVRVRLPEAERKSEHTVERLLIRTPSGAEVPLSEVAEITRGHAFTAIQRRNGRRTVTVSASAVPIKKTGEIIAALKADVLPQLARDIPGLHYSFEGRQASMRDSMASLRFGFLLAMVAIYILLVVPFRSYVQPLIIMLAIPFGAVGAVLGHVLMDYSLSLISMMGAIALSGVVVNDGLVMVDYANRRRDEGISPQTAVHEAALRRFRPILLTTLTTFGGLAPMIFETSRQARFLIPMALSLGYGILFATPIVLILLPCLYLMIEDAKALGRRIFAGPRSPSPPEASPIARGLP